MSFVQRGKNIAALCKRQFYGIPDLSVKIFSVRYVLKIRVGLILRYVLVFSVSLI